MTQHTKAFDTIRGKLRWWYLHGGGRPWHVQAFLIAAQLNVPERCVREIFVLLDTLGLVSITTWSKQAWREISYKECPIPDFFYNRDDANYVRVTPLFSF